MARYEELRRLDKKIRNKLRAILSDGDSNAMDRLASLRATLGRDQAEALDSVIKGLKHEKVVQVSTPFPKRPPFADTVRPLREVNLDMLLSIIEANVIAHKPRLQRLAQSLRLVDEAYAARQHAACLQLIQGVIALDGWSHALLRRIVLLRENLPKGDVDDKIETLMQQANLGLTAVASLVNSYSLEQSFS